MMLYDAIWYYIMWCDIVWCDMLSRTVPWFGVTSWIKYIHSCCLNDGWRWSMAFIILSLSLALSLLPLHTSSLHFTPPPSPLLPSSHLPSSFFSLLRTVRNWRPRRFGGGLGGRKGVKSRKEIEVSVACPIVICSCPTHSITSSFLSHLYDSFVLNSLSVLLNNWRMPKQGKRLKIKQTRCL